MCALHRTCLARNLPTRSMWHRRLALRNSIPHFSRSFWTGRAAAMSACTRSTHRRTSRRGQDAGLGRWGDFVRGEDIGRTAELAGDGDPAVLDHVVTIFLRKALQHVFDAV